MLSHANNGRTATALPANPVTDQPLMERPVMVNLRRLIWLYFWLLIFEGALRKWALPQLSNPLLIIRDPVVIAIYLMAIRARVFPTNAWVFSLGIIAFLSLIVSYIPLWPYLAPTRITLVAGFGFRSNFLHLPLLFVIANVFRAEDLKRLGWWTLVTVIPMCVLMVGQFHAAPDAFLNRTAGGEGEMMIAALGKVRTAATFSFVVGVVAYFALAAAFLLWATLNRGTYKNWVVFGAAGALAIGTAVSGSRSVVAGILMVVASLAVIVFLRPSAMGRVGQTLVVALVIALVMSQTPIFKEGLNVLTTRFQEVADATEKSVGAGAAERMFEQFTESFYVLTKAPFLGYGLGIGTNGGAKFLTGRQMFLLSEGEWARNFLESGPVLGLAYVVWRCALVVWVGLMCVRAVKLGNTLPILLFSGTALLLANGQFGQPTVLGFAVFVTGLALAALKQTQPEVAEATPPSPQRQGGFRPVKGRSDYANRLHGPAARPAEQTNGAVDR